MQPGFDMLRNGTGRLLALGLMLPILAGCGKSTRLTFTQSSKEGPRTFLLTARSATWANSEDGKALLALTYRWDTHAGQFILDGVRSKYVRLIITLPESIAGAGSSGEYDLGPGLVRGYDDYTRRGMCYTGGPGRINVRCDADNKLVGSFEVKCRGFFPGRTETSRFSDDYILRAGFEALPDAPATRVAAKEIGWFFASPKRRPVPSKR